MKKYVDEALTKNPSINKLIGNNPLQIMYNNHTHHAAFMETVFSIGNYELLAKTVPWVYKAYFAHHFSYEYFLVELNLWLESLEKYSENGSFNEIENIYKWMIQHHEDMIYLSKSLKGSKTPIDEQWLERKNTFLVAILEGDHHACLTIAENCISTSDDVENFYMQIIQPVMYEVGMLWEEGTVSVAEEHLSSAIVSRVMATTSMIGLNPRPSLGKAVITAAPNEFHETGAWMISDILEREGWAVRYLGSNTPINDLLEMLRSFNPDLLAISVTMPFNIIETKEIIEAIKKDEKLNKIHVIVGGRAFNDVKDLWKKTGADSFASNLQDAKLVSNKLVKNAVN